MKKSELRRKTELKPGKPLRRTALNASPLARSQVHARQKKSNQKPSRTPAIPAKVRAALAERSGGVCEMALVGCTGIATDPAHRVRTGMGGRKGQAKTGHDVLSNLTHACRACHEWTHSEPIQARGLGLMLLDGSNPLKAPAFCRGRWVLLTDDGQILPAPPPIAEEAK